MYAFLLEYILLNFVLSCYLVRILIFFDLGISAEIIPNINLSHRNRTIEIVRKFYIKNRYGKFIEFALPMSVIPVKERESRVSESCDQMSANE